MLTLPDGPRPVRLPLERGGRRVPRPGRPGRRPAGVRARPGRGAVRPRLARGLAAGRRVGAGDPRPAPRGRTAPGSTSRWPRRSTRSRSGSASRSRRSTAGSASCVARPAARPRRASRPRRPAERRGRRRGRRRPAAPPAAPIRPRGPRPDRPRADPDRPERARASVGRLISRVAVASIRDAPLRTILQACYDLYGEGQPPTFERVACGWTTPSVRALAAGLLLPIDSAPLPEDVRPAPWEDRLAGVLRQARPSATGRTGSGT